MTTSTNPWLMSLRRLQFRVLGDYLQLRRLYRAAGQAPSNPLKFLFKTPIIIGIFLLPLPMFRKWRATFCLYMFLRTVDDYADGKLPLPDGYTVERVCRHTTKLLETSGRRLREKSFLTDSFIVYALQVAEVKLGLDIRPPTSLMWEAYLADALQSQPEPDGDTQFLRKQAVTTSVVFLAMLLNLLGSRYEAAERFAGRLYDPLYRLDGLLDLFEDLQSDSVNLDLMAMAPELPWEEMRRCKSWPELLAVPGVEEWYLATVTQEAAAWGSLLPELLAEADRIIPDRLARWLVSRQLTYFQSYFGRCFAHTNAARTPTPVRRQTAQLVQV